MSQTVTLLTGTVFLAGDAKHQIQLAGSASCTFPDASSLDDVAEILAAMDDRQSIAGVSQSKNLATNAASLNRQIIAGSDVTQYPGLYFPVGGVTVFTAGDALDISYDAHGRKIYTDRGQPPAAPTAAVAGGTPGVINVTFAVQVNSASSDYKTGFSAKVNTVARTINSAALQGGNLIINLTLASNVSHGDTVTFSYDATLGNIKSLNGAQVQSFTDVAVTNNV
jgi:hypothetical protein